MAADGPGKVEAHQIEHIINAILGCRTLSKSQSQKERKNTGAQTAITEEPQFQEVESLVTTILPAKQETWANVAASKPSMKMHNKPTLSKPLQGARTDSRLMVRLGENSHIEMNIHSSCRKKPTVIDQPSNKSKTLG